jgi:hypothetical protein
MRFCSPKKVCYNHDNEYQTNGKSKSPAGVDRTHGTGKDVNALRHYFYSADYTVKTAIFQDRFLKHKKADGEVKNLAISFFR